MISKSNESFQQLTEEITERNSGGSPSQPPVIAAQNPFLEVVMRDLAASLPHEMKTRMEAGTSIAEVYDWIAAGALYRWIGSDRRKCAAFLAELSGDPRRAGMALLRSIALSEGPPERNPEWRRHDHIGLLLQMVLACLVSAFRTFLLYEVAFFGTEHFFQPATVMPDWLRLDARLPEWSHLGVWLASAAIWLGLEAILVPRLMEGLRQVPAMRKGAPLPVAWRIEAFYVYWCLQPIPFLSYVCYKGIRHLPELFRFSGVMPVVLALITIVLPVLAVWHSIASVKPSSKLGQFVPR